METSKGKMRPSLPRSGDLPTVSDADRERAGERSADGRFRTGNVIGRGRGWKRAIAKQLGRQVDDPIAQVVADDAWRVFSAALRELPSDGPMVRGLAALMARHQALAAFWTAQAATVGLTSDAGIAAQEQATKHGQRAERLAVTCLDIAIRLTRKSAGGDRWVNPWVENDGDGPDEPETAASPRADSEDSQDE
jgi:hypothetical protein